MSNCLFGWPNGFVYGAITVSSAEAALPGSNLSNDQGSADQAWQTVGIAGRVTLTLPAAGPIRVVSVHRTNLTAAAQLHCAILDALGGVVWDSGTLTPQIVPGYAQAILMLPPGISGQVVQLDISDPANPDGFLNVALAFAGPAWQPSLNFDENSGTGRSNQLTETITRSGGSITRDDWIKRVFDLSLSGVISADVWPQLMALDLWCRRGNNMLFIPDPDAVEIGQQPIFGQLLPITNITYPLKAVDARGYRATISERL